MFYSVYKHLITIKGIDLRILMLFWLNFFYGIKSEIDKANFLPK